MAAGAPTKARAGSSPKGGAGAASGTPKSSKANPSDRTALAGRLWASTGDQGKVEQALRELGSSPADAKRLAAQAAGQPETPPAAPQGAGSGSSGPAPAKGLPTPTLTPPRRLSGQDGGGFLLGLALFAIGQSFIRYGPAGVTSWFGAKFVNRPNPAIVAREAARGVAPKAHGTLSAPGVAPTPAPNFNQGTPPKGTPKVPPTERFGR